ncbi:MAG TPA: Gfo/Idh/MocA family oxidoreductase, partial [Burkholderiales bacterium]|nr:Gfo/Idh/MocA family oxidoreductase [Burkholderiales bacterium]
MSKLPVAVCGLGWWGRIIVPLLKTSAKLEVAKVFDPQVTEDFGVPRAKSFDDVLSDRKVQGVVLCTPHTLHTGQIVKAAAAGKHVFCEKPLSMNRENVLE